ncbi:hypothetical protein DIPPA_17100 [Diplonema papillatum]|nr:hypothetical protein DIPPA_33013 [Diplonema papillatum]KAJ9473666.1 hypothetical protein DIPPA_17100 [Diplonema papillatum]
MTSYGNRSGGPAGIIASAPRAGTPTSARANGGVMSSTMGYYSATGAATSLDKNGASSNRYSTLLSYNRPSYGTPQKSMPQYSNAAQEQPCPPSRPQQSSRLGGTGRSSSIPATSRTTRLTKTPSNYWDKQQPGNGSSTPRLSGATAQWTASNAYTAGAGYTSNAPGNAANTANAGVSMANTAGSYQQQRASTPGRTRLSYYSNTTAAANSYYNNNGSVAMSMTGSNQQAVISNPQKPLRNTRVTLVLDLDETLVHSSFDPIPADLHIPLVMDGEHYVAYVNKRPHLERFLARCVELFDVIVWTASLSVYAEPLINELCRMARCGNLKKMYREHCTEVAGGGYVKDLTTIGRSLEDLVILDNSPSVAVFQPNNLINIVSWYDDSNDTALLELIPMLEHLTSTPSVYHAVPQLNQVMCKQIGN